MRFSGIFQCCFWGIFSPFFAPFLRHFSAIFWRILAVFGYFEAIVGSFFGSFWRFLAIFGGFWQFFCLETRSFDNGFVALPHIRRVTIKKIGFLGVF
jgi:hypothetical protein